MSFNKEKIRVLEQIKSLDNVIRGSIFEMKRFCGKKNCICAKTKTPHRSMFLSFKYEGKTRMVPIRKEQIAQVKKRIKNYKELKAAIDELARINAELLRSAE